ncbi:MAG: DNA gyrase inhibitor YacG [Pseudomonadota bacterium]
MTKEKAKPCPHCGKKAQWKDNPYRPFCSERCKLIDLGGWASEKYRIAGEKAGGGELEKDEERSEDEE